MEKYDTQTCSNLTGHGFKDLLVKRFVICFKYMTLIYRKSIKFTLFSRVYKCECFWLLFSSFFYPLEKWWRLFCWFGSFPLSNRIMLFVLSMSRYHHFHFFLILFQRQCRRNFRLSTSSNRKFSHTSHSI